MADETVQELEKRVARTFDANALRTELESEKRSTAREAIEARIEELESPDAALETQESVSDDSTYTRDELLAGAAGFGVGPETIAGALSLAGRSSMTRQEMADAIRTFEEREV